MPETVYSTYVPAPAAAVWAEVGDYSQASWATHVKKVTCLNVKNHADMCKVGCERVVTMQDGNECSETLEFYDPCNYKLVYSINDMPDKPKTGPFEGFKEGKMTIQVIPDTLNSSCVVQWRLQWDVTDTPSEEFTTSHLNKSMKALSEHFKSEPYHKYATPEGQAEIKQPIIEYRETFKVT